VLVVDCGFDAGVMFEDWLDNKYHFVARLVGNRHLLRFCGDFGSANAEVQGNGYRFKHVNLQSKHRLHIASTNLSSVKVSLLFALRRLAG